MLTRPADLPPCCRAEPPALANMSSRCGSGRPRACHTATVTQFHATRFGSAGMTIDNGNCLRSCVSRAALQGLSVSLSFEIVKDGRLTLLTFAAELLRKSPA